jgi:SAM-dependent methyltransferase
LIIKTECSICEGSLEEIINLGECPPANNFVEKKNQDVESFPLIIDFCQQCYCIQLRHCLSKKELYSFYTYSTPQIDSLAKHYENLLKKLKELNFAQKSQSCIEIGSNNGNLLNFLKPHFNKVLGVDPASNIASIAIENGVETIIDFFSNKVAKKILEKNTKFDVAIARHMFAHNEDPSEMLSAMDKILDESGVFIIENAYAIDTFKNGEFDQIYHEHMFYFSALNINALMNKFNFELIDFEHAPVHGGSGVFICGKKGKHTIQKSVDKILSEEEKYFNDKKIFQNFREKIEATRKQVIELIAKDISSNKIVGAYGAPAKAFTVFSYYGLNHRNISFCVDTTPTKIGKVFPKFNIPIIAEDELADHDYDTLIVNAWNYKEDILKKSSSIFKKGTKLIFIIPNLEIYTVN